MGMIGVQLSGSFGFKARNFGAMEHGHAHAVIECLNFLASEVLPAAVEQDMRLLEQGAEPAKGFYPSEDADA